MRSDNTEGNLRPGLTRGLCLQVDGSLCWLARMVLSRHLVRTCVCVLPGLAMGCIYAFQTYAAH